MVVVALFFFFSGFLILCECPGWFILSGVIAGLALPRGTRKIRIFAGMVVVAAAAMALVQILEMRKDQRFRDGRRNREHAKTNESNVDPLGGRRIGAPAKKGHAGRNLGIRVLTVGGAVGMGSSDIVDALLHGGARKRRRARALHNLAGRRERWV
jgi:hypothetical protein